LEKVDETSRQLVEVSAIDNTDGEILLYSDLSDLESHSENLSNTDSMKMYSRNWVLTTQPKEKFLTTHKPSNLPLILLLTGLLTTALVAISLLLLVTRNAKVEKEVKERTEELTETYGKLRDSEVMLMQSEKMSALGQMVAGVAHELNTPLGYVRSNIQIMQEHFQDLTSLLLKMIKDQEPPEGFSKDLAQPVRRLLQLIDDRVDPATMSDVCNDSMDGIDHLSNIVVSLKNFSRKDMLDVEKASMNDCLDNSLMIAHSKIKSKAEVTTDYGDIPKITCYPSKLNQVFLNIITNAVDSIEDFGTLHIRTSYENEQVIVSITDTGCGMTEEECNKIFEPFHTTKDVGKGTGLGLFICDRIVDEHGGRIEVRSAPDQGSEFIIYLPLTLPDPDQIMKSKKVIKHPGEQAMQNLV
jgi:signal transduction histidine kinase